MKLEDAINRTAKNSINRTKKFLNNKSNSHHQYTSLYFLGSNNLIIMYGLSNVPKQNYSPLRPILAAFSQHSFIQPCKISGFHS